MNDDSSLSKRGLSSAEATRRLAQHGANEIERQPPPSPFWLFASQFRSPVVLLLIAACLVSAALGETVNAAAIGAIVFVNGLIGFFQEYKAERSLLALRAMTAPRARVIRDGASMIIPAADVVPGDWLALEAGDLVAADARLIEANLLAANEAALTGESVPSEKSTRPSGPEAPLAEFRIGNLTLAECLLSVGVALLPVTLLEVSKLLQRARSGQDAQRVHAL